MTRAARRLLLLAATVAAGCRGLRVPPSLVWRQYAERPRDLASLSCYQFPNGTWACAEDAHFAYDPEDSY